MKDSSRSSWNSLWAVKKRDWLWITEPSRPSAIAPLSWRGSTSSSSVVCKRTERERTAMKPLCIPTPCIPHQNSSKHFSSFKPIIQLFTNSDQTRHLYELQRNWLKEKLMLIWLRKRIKEAFFSSFFCCESKLGREEALYLMVALASHQTAATKSEQLKRQWPGKRKDA